MTSKNSFLANLKTNSRRRIWLAVLILLYFFFSLPVGTAIKLSMEKTYYMDMPERLANHLMAVFCEYVGIDAGKLFFITILAVIAAIQGFSYMYQRKKLDMYGSVPVSKGKRFAAIYVNGILIYLVSYVLNLFLSFGVAQSMGVPSVYAVTEALTALLANTVLFFAVYNTVILAVMLTGHILITVMASGVLLLYDAFIYALTMMYFSTYFVSYYWKTEDLFRCMLITPVSRFVVMISEAFTYTNNWMAEGRILYFGKIAAGCVHILIYGIIMLALAYFAYCRKPSEACGKAIAFPKMKGLIKVLLVIPLGLTAGAAFYELSGQSEFLCVFGLIAGLLLSHAVMEVCYDFDLRSVKKGWKSLLLSAVGTAVVFGVFRFDLTGYDRYVPESERVDSVAFMFEDTYTDYYDEQMNNVSREVYVLGNMQLLDIEPVLTLAQRRMGINYSDSVNPYEPALYARAGAGAVSVIGGSDGPTSVFLAGKVNAEEPLLTEETPENMRPVVVRYNMKNGRTIYRRFWVHFLNDSTELDQIVAQESYKKSTSPVYNDAAFAKADKMRIHFSRNGYQQTELSRDITKKLLEAYKRDLGGFTYTQSVTELVCGELRFEYNDNYSYAYIRLPIYPSFAEVRALVESEGCITDSYIRPEEVQTLYVTNSNSELRNESGDDYKDYSVEEEFSDPSEIARILDCIYPDCFVDYYMPANLLDSDYYVQVIAKAPDDSNYRSDYGSTYMVLRDRLPEFVKERTVYRGEEE